MSVAATAPGIRYRGRLPLSQLFGAAIGLVAALLTIVAAPRAAAAQSSERSVRLAIIEVSDSTFSFDASNLRWIKAGERGMAVDPKRRDALVARFDVLHVENGRATALITGATTDLTTEHVVVMEVPLRPWYRSTLFWGGALAGSIIGALLRSL
jgi:hypothetical protein